jgi:UDP-N-acetylglucosamine 2-epimerase
MFARGISCQAVNPYGDGTASQRIVQTIEKVI